MEGAAVEPVLKSIPEIIKQASQSQLGILALSIIVLFGLAIYFFRKAPIKWRALIFCLFFGGVAVYAVQMNRVASKPQAAHYMGRVLDGVTKQPLHESRVIVTMNNKQSPPYRTDSDGQFSFWLLRQEATEDARLRVDHENYQPYDRIVSSDASNQLGDIPLARVSLSAQGAEPPSIPNGPQPTSSNVVSNPPTSRIGILAGRRLAPLGTEIHPATRLPNTASLATTSTGAATAKVLEASSGPKLSGKGKEWSPWYRVTVGPGPAGYKVDKDDFWLSGDRTCGAWAECKVVSKSDSEVTWDFRLQGHDEWGAPPQAYSEGHLRVSYSLK